MAFPAVEKQIHLMPSSNLPWITGDGLGMLAIQAIHQFELMTGRKEPEAMMKSQVHSRSTTSSLSQGFLPSWPNVCQTSATPSHPLPSRGKDFRGLEEEQ